MPSANANEELSEVRPSEDAIHDVAGAYMDQLREKILFGLSIYKFLSPTMLHTFLGTSTPVSLWKEQVLADLLAKGEVVSETVTLTSPHDRQQSYQVLHLPDNVYIPPETTTPPSSDPEQARACASDEPEADVAA